MASQRTNQLTTAVASRLPMPANVVISPQQWRVLTDAIFPNAKTPEAVMMALDYCRVRNLDPFKRPVHIVSMYSTASKRYIETVWPGINELQVTAARSGAWAGMDEPAWGPNREYELSGGGGEDENGQTIAPKTVKLTVPESCTVTVYRNVGGRREAFAEPVYWLEAYARISQKSELPNSMWLKRPRGQLHKCAKAASLRAAFPEDLGSEYAAEEMEGRDTDKTGPTIQTNVSEHTEEESEFVVRAADRLEATLSNASAWLKALLAILGEAPSTTDLAAVTSWQAVKKALKDAPTMIREQIRDAITAAEKRLSGDPEQPKEGAPEEKAAVAPVDDDTFPGDRP
jgi:phage recombination protein Bet